MIYIKKWLENYAELFPIAESQVEFFTKIGKDFSSPVKFVSLECGTAALAQELLMNSFDVTATDSFKEFIDLLKIKSSNTEPKLKAFNLYPQDIGRYLGKNFYNIIYLGDYRVVFMRDKIYISKLMMDAKALLSDGGYLIFDLINFSKFDFSKDEIYLPEKHSTRATLRSWITKDKENITYLLHQQVETSNGKTIDEVKDEPVTPISMESFKKFAKELEFSSLEFYSDYKMNPLTPDSEKIVCVLKK
ncbi:MAG: hypothetical protein K6C98_01585 [Treponema sp.]|jgi:hypothetical protein|nr:hypothetical protein [Treponema sp.]